MILLPEITSPAFRARARQALADEQLQQALSKLKAGFQKKRYQALEQLPEYEALREEARQIKDFVLSHLDYYLEMFEARVLEAGGQVHWARDRAEAREVVGRICTQAGAGKVLKGKSMITEEIDLNKHLESLGMDVLETDLGEYIIQLRKEIPSHIIAPAIHVSKQQVASDFRSAHTQLEPDRALDDIAALLEEARSVLRDQLLSADVGITGANLLIAQTGTSVIVTNEGNGDLVQSRARCHIVVASLEKLVPSLDDANTVLRLLARSATGQELSVYTTFSTGPKRSEDLDGPESYHVVLLDGGRSNLLGTAFEPMLRCIRCGACMNHCPIYAAVGGHAYGWVYPGPIGAVLNPGLVGVRATAHLPNASSFCGRCEQVCPVKIPLPDLMRRWRERALEEGYTPRHYRWGLKVWAWLAKRPRLYRQVTGWSARLLALLAGRKGYLASLPLAAGWVQTRNLPRPTGKTFFQRLAEQESDE